MFGPFNTGSMRGAFVSFTVFDSVYFMNILANLKEKNFIGSEIPPFPTQSIGEQTIFGTENFEYHSTSFAQYLIRSSVLKSTDKKGKSKTGYFLMVMWAVGDS